MGSFLPTNRMQSDHKAVRSGFAGVTGQSNEYDYRSGTPASMLSGVEVINDLCGRG